MPRKPSFIEAPEDIAADIRSELEAVERDEAALSNAIAKRRMPGPRDEALHVSLCGIASAAWSVAAELRICGNAPKTEDRLEALMIEMGRARLLWLKRREDAAELDAAEVETA